MSDNSAVLVESTPCQAGAVSKGKLWARRIISGLPAAFLLFDGAMKLVKPEFVVKATIQLGYPDSVIVPLGSVLLGCTVLYLIPSTSLLGAILLTGYLGGAVATHVRVGAGLFEVTFPVIVGALLWGGLFLRESRLTQLIAMRRCAATKVPREAK